MLNEAARLLDTTMREWQQERDTFRVEQFFDMAVLCGSVEASPLDKDSLVFLLAGAEKCIYEGVAYQFRFALGQLGLVVDEIRFPELGKPIEFTEEEVAQEAARLSIQLYLPEDDKEDFHARFVREQTGEKMPPRRLEQVYSNLSTRRRLEREQHGVERVNKYGFDVTIDCPYGTTAVVPLHIKVSNDRMNPPYNFCIRKTD